MDFIIELPLTIRGHTGIVVFVDRLMKMVRLAPLRTDFSAKRGRLVDQSGLQASWPSR